MHRAMSNQEINVSKAGINATLPTRTTVVAAANPKHGRWDTYQADADQVELSSTLRSRFGLIFKLKDRPDEETDHEHGRHMAEMKEAEKARDDPDATSDVDPDPAIEHDLLRKLVAVGRREFDPRFRGGDDEALKEMVESFVTLWGANGYDEDNAIPVTKRKLEDIHRLAEASARARLSEWIEQEDVHRAQRLIGESLRDYGQNEEGDLDADIVETGQSKPQQDRIRELADLIEEEQPASGGLDIDDLVDVAGEHGYDERTVRDTVEVMLEKGEAYQPEGHGSVRRWS